MTAEQIPEERREQPESFNDVLLRARQGLEKCDADYGEGGAVETRLETITESLERIQQRLTLLKTKQLILMQNSENHLVEVEQKEAQKGDPLFVARPDLLPAHLASIDALHKALGLAFIRKCKLEREIASLTAEAQKWMGEAEGYDESREFARDIILPDAAALCAQMGRLRPVNYDTTPIELGDLDEDLASIKEDPLNLSAGKLSVVLNMSMQPRPYVPPSHAATLSLDKVSTESTRPVSVTIPGIDD